MRAVVSTLLAAVMCAAVVSTASCKGPAVEMQVNALGAADPTTHPTYYLAPGNEGVTEGDLEFREFAEYAERALADRGFRRTDDIEAASAVVLFAYGVSDPKTFTQQSAVPVWGSPGRRPGA